MPKNNNQKETPTLVGELIFNKKKDQGEGESPVVNPTPPPPSIPFDGVRVAPGLFHHHYKVEREGAYEFSLSVPGGSIAVFNLGNLSRPLGKYEGKAALNLTPGNFLFVVRVGESTPYVATFRES